MHIILSICITETYRIHFSPNMEMLFMEMVFIDNKIHFSPNMEMLFIDNIVMYYEYCISYLQINPK